MNQERQRVESAWFGVPQRRISGGHQTTSRFSRQRRLASILLICASLFVLSANKHADAQIKFELDGPLLIDDGDFNGGLPATWSELGGGEAKLDASSGNLLIDRTGDPNEAVTYAELANTMLSEVSIRAQARMRNEDRTNAPKSDPNFDPTFGPAVSFAARTCFNDIPHVCGGDPDEWIYIDFYSNGEAHTAQSSAHGERVEATDILPLEEDVVLQLDAFGEDIKFWVWRPGEPRPAEPIIQYTAEDEPTTDPGGVMFGTVYADAVFRYVHVSPTPIPAHVLGDFNGDGLPTANDIDLLSEAILQSNLDPGFDLNGDGAVNYVDREVWVTSEDVANTFFGDTDLNGEVDFGDFLALSNNFGQDGGWAQGNFDGLGDVQFGDFLLLSSNFGNVREATLAQSVPEPHSSVLGLICCLCLVGRQTRRVIVSYSR